MAPLARRALFIVIAVIALAAGFWAALSMRSPSDDLDYTPDFALPDIDGYSRQLSHWRGKVILVNFWATWCAPCREEIPLLKRAQERHAARGLQVIGVAIDSEEAVSAYHREIRFNYPVLIGEIDAIWLLPAYGNPTGGLPFSALINAEGRIIHRKAGAYRPEELEAALESALPNRPDPGK